VSSTGSIDVYRVVDEKTTINILLVNSKHYYVGRMSFMTVAVH